MSSEPFDRRSTSRLALQNPRLLNHAIEVLGLHRAARKARDCGKIPLFQRTPPAHLTRHMLFAILAYRIQADRFGDLDHETKQVLDRTVAKETGPREASDRPSGIAIRRMQAMIAVKRATILLRFDWLTGLIGALLR